MKAKEALALGAMVVIQSISAVTWAADDAPTTAPKIQEKSAVLTNETRIYLGQCLFQAPSPAGGGDIKLQMIDPGLALATGKFLIDTTAAMIKVASDDERVNTIAAFPASGWFYKVNGDLSISMNPDYQCLQVVTGRFKTAFSPPSHTPLARNATLEELKNALGLQRSEVDVARTFFEARIEPFNSTPKSPPAVFRLAPNAFYFEDPLESRFNDYFHDHIKRSIAITISFARADSAEASTSFGSFVIPFPQMEKGKYLTPDYFTNLSTKPIPIPAVSSDEKETYTKKKTALAAAELALKTPKPSVPPKLTPLPKADKTYVEKRTLYCTENGKLDKDKQDSVCALPMSDYKLEMDRAREEQVAQFVFDNQQADASSPEIKCTKSPCTDDPYYMLPFSASAVVVELSEPGNFAKFMNDFAQVISPTAKTALETSITKRNTDPKIAIDAAAGKMDDYYESVAKVKLAEADLAATTAAVDIKAKKEALVTLKKDANTKARAAGVTAPYDLSHPY